ncbi:MAG TPA: HD domain-containing protein, partial [Ktedonobacterales bacterium]|nr:HD domain-containing protein [Ktedonobacterales bacterium]
ALSRLGAELPTTLRTLLAAAMLHDCGHYPFSHAIEELGAPIISHERVGRRIIESGAVAATLERHGLSPQRVADLVDPPRDRALPLGDGLLIRLLSGPLDVDKLDYLPRDARGCNVPYGGVDVTRLLSALRLLPATPGGGQTHEVPLVALRLGVNDKGISPLNSLLHARQEMFDNVYWHHTNRAMMAMLLRAVQEALLADRLAPEALPGYDDAALLAALSADTMPVATRVLIADLRGRRPYKTLLEVSARAGSVFQLLDTLFWDQAKRRRVEIALAEAVNVALGEALSAPLADFDILVDVPKPEKWEVDTLVAFAHPPLGMAPLLTWTEATGQRPDDLGVYERRQRRIRLVASEAVRDLIGPRAAELLVPVIERIPML